MKRETVLLTAAILAAAPATATVTPVSGLVQFQSSVKLLDEVTLGVHDIDDWSALQPGIAFNASSAVEAINLTAVPGGARRYSFGSASATWLSESNGIVDFHWGFAQQGGGQGYTTNDTVNPNWRYTFTLSTPATFDFSFKASYEAIISDSVFGIGGFYLDPGPMHCCDYNVGFVLEDIDPFFIGSGSVPLAAGTHTVSLYNLTWRSAGSSTREVEGFDTIRWAINPVAGGVPEPASWAMLITGFGLIGAAMRRRNQKAQLRVVAA
jgi:hypothetical protein